MQLTNAHARVSGQQSLFAMPISRLAEVRWTIGLTVAMFLANWGLLAKGHSYAMPLLELLEYDRNAILRGQLWRLVTGNLVHWSAEHFWLDISAFFILGTMYESSFRRPVVSLFKLLLTVSLIIGAAVLVIRPGMNTYRGLSGVDSGVFAAVLLMELLQANKQRERWLFLAPAALIFTAKIVFECWTGEMFFGTSALGNLGEPVPLAHAAGTLAAFPAILATRKPRARPVLD